METFKTYILKEDASYYKNVAHLIAMGYVPLVQRIIDILSENKIKTVYHATTLDFLPGMKKLGKTKKQISTFTKGLPSIIQNISTKPEVLCVLEGELIFESKFDIFSHPDDKGIRWLSTRGDKRSDFLLEAFLKPIIKLLNDKGNFKLNNQQMEDLLSDDFMFEKYFDELQEKHKKLIILEYKKNVARILKNKMYSKMIVEILSKDKRNWKHNEIIMRQFNVLGVYAIENGRYLFDHSLAEHQITDMGYKYLGFIPKEDFNKTRLE